MPPLLVVSRPPCLPISERANGVFRPSTTAAAFESTISLSVCVCAWYCERTAVVCGTACCCAGRTVVAESERAENERERRLPVRAAALATVVGVHAAYNNTTIDVVSNPIRRTSEPTHTPTSASCCCSPSLLQHNCCTSPVGGGHPITTTTTAAIRHSVGTSSAHVFAVPHTRTPLLNLTEPPRESLLQSARASKLSPLPQVAELFAW